MYDPVDYLFEPQIKFACDRSLKDLKTEWYFEKLEENKTKILFNIKFEFQKFLHQKLAEFFFDLIENQMIDSFKKRADEILD